MRKLIALALLLCLLAGCEPQTLNKCPGFCPRAAQDGSVLFWDSGILVRPIYRNTGSTLTHAAIILYIGGEPWIYEAVPPRVHRVPLNVYLKEMRDKEARPAMQRREFSWFIMQPRVAYTTTELLAMKRYANSELGRPYMMRGWWKGHVVRGIFCSQLVADIIEQSGRITSDNIKESPGSLYAKLTPLYQ